LEKPHGDAQQQPKQRRNRLTLFAVSVNILIWPVMPNFSFAATTRLTADFSSTPSIITNG
jgi:hypothetical protein